MKNVVVLYKGRNSIQDKNRIIKEILAQKGIDIDWEIERQKRFKSIQLGESYCLNEQSFYYNDGSIDGIHVVTFVEKELNILEKNPYVATTL